MPIPGTGIYSHVSDASSICCLSLQPPCKVSSVSAARHTEVMQTTEVIPCTQQTSEE